MTMINAPGMLEPKKGDAFLFFLVPTDRTNLFAAMTAPYDEDLTVFRLDRSFWAYRGYTVRQEQKDSLFYERNSVVWSLVDDAQQILPSGAELMRNTYAKEISMAPSNRVIYLQWQTQTNQAGWRRDIPKETKNGQK
jgi:hypothetical protein